MESLRGIFLLDAVFAINHFMVTLQMHYSLENYYNWVDIFNDDEKIPGN